MNNSVEPLILFNEGHQGLLELHVHLVGVCVCVRACVCVCVCVCVGGWERRVSSMGKKRAVLCCIASGKSRASRFSLREFDIWYFFL